MNINDPLATLVSAEAKTIDRKKIADFLQPFISIDSETKEIGFLPSFDKLNSNGDKIEVVLMAKKAISLLFGEIEGVMPTAIAAMNIMPLGSTKSALKRLLKDKKIKQDKDGKYYVPNYRIADLMQKHLKDKNNSNE